RRRALTYNTPRDESRIFHTGITARRQFPAEDHDALSASGTEGSRSLTASREAPSAKVPHAPTLSVVIPVYNERGTIEELLWRVHQVGLEKEVIVVADASTAGTPELLHQIAHRIASGSASAVLP